MSKHDQTDQVDEKFHEIEESLNSAEVFMEKNSKKLTMGFGALFLLAVVIIGYFKYYKAPREEKARVEVFVAQNNFERDSFDIALNGDGSGNSGFLDIIDNYGGTPTANMANYYAGISYLQLGKYEDAIKYLSDFSTDDRMLKPIAIGAQGDAYAQLDNTTKAVEMYVKAANSVKNDMTTPLYLFKAAKLSEMNGDKANAVKYLEIVKKDYPKSNEARVVNKYIERLK
ncbi:tetratricopeptide repeat protein [Halosquirtibacter xylanolyticus]|uniref:tetratricopeptide repeat protein n=1 Tax=Halosquirtibacter xylanolyticus TaxID=3374599 RepID=UPI003748E274|nr:tetratricopeptide repeat protein [Prolixibacteraceae bacterium]